MDDGFHFPNICVSVGTNEIIGQCSLEKTPGPPRQATGPPRLGAGVGVGMCVEGEVFKINRKGHSLVESNN